ncbi:unnamed protein product [Angiostrongylus costaricensis]|uniref:ARL2_Bind_BART domain-containing protein n=1 Tax=Angiostrongylus costaricensis TaxID=334426 RepID=A0A0R3PNP1_ANGCS|nr:unnamed protein product [Angiostrongylus costaricensis]
MIAWSEKELDEITDEFLSMMLGEQEFLDRWAMNVEAELAYAEEVSVSSTVLPCYSILLIALWSQFLVMLSSQVCNMMAKSSYFTCNLSLVSLNEVDI